MDRRRRGFASETAKPSGLPSPRPVVVPSVLRPSSVSAADIRAAVSKFVTQGLPAVFSAIWKYGVVLPAETMWWAVADRPRFSARMQYAWEVTKHEAHHYWLGSKLLGLEFRTSAGLIVRRLRGYPLSRRERRQLVRSAADVFRLVPFIIFVVVPFAELLLPITLKFFPNILPSTFKTESDKVQEQKRVLQLRVQLAGFLQDTMEYMSEQMAARDDDAAGAKSSSLTVAADGTTSPTATGGGSGAKQLLELVRSARQGQVLSTEDIVRMARLFKDELTLDSTGRTEMIAMCRMLGLNPYGTDGFLRFQLRARLVAINEDDAEIRREGIASLNKEELQEACRDRGMRAADLTEEGLRMQLQQWLDLSQNKEVPVALLLLSRAFTYTSASVMTSASAERALQSSIAQLDETVVREAVLDAAHVAGSSDDVFVRQLRIESIARENELIGMERAAKAAATKAQQLEVEANSKRAAADLSKRSGTPSEAALALRVAAEAAQAAADAGQKARDAYTALRQAAGHEASMGAAHRRASTESAEPTLAPAELQALEAMASASVMQHERSLLSRIRAARLRMDATDMLSVGRIGVEEDAPLATGAAPAAAPAAPPSETGTPLASAGRRLAADAAAQRVKGVLDHLLVTLENDIESADQAIGKTLPVIDRDRDGVLTAEELHDAIRNVLRNQQTDEAAAAIVRQLDADRDGNITIEEIKQYAMLRAAAEAEVDAMHPTEVQRAVAIAVDELATSSESDREARSATEDEDDLGDSKTRSKPLHLRHRQDHHDHELPPSEADPRR